MPIDRSGSEVVAMRHSSIRFNRSFAQFLALLLISSLLTLGCPPTGTTLAPQAGVRAYQEAGFIPVPGGRVNVIGGNFVVERVDLGFPAPPTFSPSG